MQSGLAASDSEIVSIGKGFRLCALSMIYIERGQRRTRLDGYHTVNW